jgi:hypothetical protein
MHTGDEAAAAATSIGAAAFTVGQHIFLDDKRVPPTSTRGYATLAHEVVHTVQNAGAAAAPSLAAGTPTTHAGDGVETEATDLAATLTAGRSAAEPVPVTEPGRAAVAGVWPFTETDTRTTRQRIDDALRSGEPDDVKAIDNIYVATVDERVRMLHILVDQWWAGNSDESMMEDIWGSFGSRVGEVAARDGLVLWDACIDKGAELEDLSEVVKMRNSFISDVTTLANQYLDQNRASMQAERAKYGLPAGGGAPAPPTPEQTQQIIDLQKMAASVALLQKAQEAARATPVGYDLHIVQGGPDMPPAVTWHAANFDPNKPPDSMEEPEGGFMQPVFKADKIYPYEPIKKAYEETNAVLATILRGYPAIFAITRENSSAATEKFATMDPAAARIQLGTGLQAVLASINSAQGKLGDDLDPLDLIPLHQQLFAGKPGISGVDWTTMLAQRIAKDKIRDHEFSRALTAMGLSLASQALFILAPFTGGLSIALAVALGGLVIAGVQWSMSAAHYEAMEDAAGAGATPGTELVTPEQVKAAEAAHMADSVALALAVLTVGLMAAGAGISAMRARMERTALMNQVGQPSTVTTLRQTEVPYTDPPDLRVAKPGQPLALDELKPNRRYLWIVDEKGNFKVADEGQAGMFPNRRPLDPSHPAAGESPLKHGDLAPGPQGQTRGAARAGGELRAELDANGKFTGRWIMNNDSSYTFARTDGQTLGTTSLEAARKLLGTTGTDISKIVTTNTSGVR